MKAEELREAIRMDAQACEELTVGDEPISDENLSELMIHAESLFENLRRYRLAVRRGGE